MPGPSSLVMVRVHAGQALLRVHAGKALVRVHEGKALVHKGKGLVWVHAGVYAQLANCVVILQRGRKTLLLVFGCGGAPVSAPKCCDFLSPSLLKMLQVLCLPRCSKCCECFISPVARKVATALSGLVGTWISVWQCSLFYIIRVGPFHQSIAAPPFDFAVCQQSRIDAIQLDPRELVLLLHLPRIFQKCGQVNYRGTSPMMKHSPS